MKKYMAYIEKDKETGLYVGIIPSVPGAHSQGETLEELIDNLREVLKLCLEEMEEEERENLPNFIGTIEVTA